MLGAFYEDCGGWAEPGPLFLYASHCEKLCSGRILLVLYIHSTCTIILNCLPIQLIVSTPFHLFTHLWTSFIHSSTAIIFSHSLLSFIIQISTLIPLFIYSVSPLSKIVEPHPAPSLCQELRSDFKNTHVLPSRHSPWLQRWGRGSYYLLTTNSWDISESSEWCSFSRLNENNGLVMNGSTDVYLVSWPLVFRSMGVSQLAKIERCVLLSITDPWVALFWKQTPVCHFPNHPYLSEQEESLGAHTDQLCIKCVSLLPTLYFCPGPKSCSEDLGPVILFPDAWLSLELVFEWRPFWSGVHWRSGSVLSYPWRKEWTLASRLQGRSPGLLFSWIISAGGKKASLANFVSRLPNHIPMKSTKGLLLGWTMGTKDVPWRRQWLLSDR